MNNYDPNGFLEILDGMWWKLDRQLFLEDDYYSAMANMIDCIKNGVTTMIDHHASFAQIPGSLFELEKAAKLAGVRVNLCYEVSDRDGAEKAKQSVKENADFIKHSIEQDDDMVRAMMGMHASFTISDETMKACRENTPDDIGFHIHVAEGMDDVLHCLNTYGKRVIYRLHDQGILGKHTVLGHCIHINGNEMDLVKATGCSIVHNPESNMGNAVGLPPIVEFMKRGLTVGLGTDGFINDMIRVAAICNAAHKHTLCNPNAAWGEVPQALYYNNAAIVNNTLKHTKTGAIEAGYAADIIVLDYTPPTPMSAANCNGHIMFGMSSRAVVTTVINGKVRMKDRRLVDIDEQEVLAKSREHAAAVAKRVDGQY